MSAVMRGLGWWVTMCVLLISAPGTRGQGAFGGSAPVFSGPALSVENMTFTTPARISADAAAAATGTTLLLMPGTYTTNQLPRRLNYWLMPGADFRYVQTSTNDSGFGIVDDRGDGGRTNFFIGRGSRIELIGVTNLNLYNATIDDGTFNVSPNTRGVFVFTNPASRFYIEVGAAGAGKFSTGPEEVAVLHVVNAQTNNVFRANHVYHALRGVTHNTPSALEVPFTSTGHGLITQLGAGDLYVDFIDDLDAAYGWKFTTPASGVADWRLHFGKSLTYFYGAMGLATHRWWARGIDMDVNSSVGCLGIYDSGKGYFEAQKINNRFSAGAPAIDIQTGAGHNCSNWIHILKVEATGYWVRTVATATSSNFTFLTAQTFEANGTLAGGFLINSNCFLDVSGARMTCTTNAIMHNGGLGFFRNCYLKSLNAPNAIVTSSNLFFMNCQLVTVGFTNIYAAAAQSVGCVFTIGNKTNSVTVTDDPGTFVSDATLR